MATTDNYLVGVDIGSDKTAVVVAAPEGTDFEVLGVASVPTAGLRFGAITSIPELSATVEKAVVEAESLSGKSNRQVTLSFFGDYFRVMKRQGEADIRNRQGGVDENDRQMVIKKALPSTTPDYEIVHIIVQEYFLDDRHQISNPLRMFGQHLGVNLFLVTAVASGLKNLRRCLQDLGLEVASVSFAPFVAAEAVVTSEEMESGVAYLDFGRSAVTLTIFQPFLREVEVVARGSDRLTFALSYCLKASTAEAERIKKEYGSCLLDVEPQEFSLSNIQGEMKQIANRREVAEIIAAEMKDVLFPFQTTLKKYKPFLTAGVVLGGGGALLSGLPEFLSEELEMPVRIGTAFQFHSWEKVWKDPAYNAVLGVIKASWTKTPDYTPVFSRGTGLRRAVVKVRRIWEDLF